MKYRKVCLSVIAIVIVALISSGNEDYDFRYGKWGDNRDTIKRLDNELHPISRNELWEDNIMIGDTTFRDCDTTFSYFFDDNKLVAGIYDIKPKFTQKEELIEFYEAVFDDIKKEFGEPSEYIDFTESPKNPNYVSCYSVFKNDRTVVKFLMHNLNEGNKPEILLQWSYVEYNDKKTNKS